MNLQRKLFCIVTLIVSSDMEVCLQGAPVEQTVIKTELAGQELIKMGKLLNKPLLSLLGATFVKIEQNVNKELSERINATEKKLLDGIDQLTLNTSQERDILRIELCKQTRCTVWTGWSSCSANKNGTYGARTRSRKCGVSSSICTIKSAKTVETNYQICQGICRYTLTDNSYCIKLYKSVKKTQADAKADCHKDGGHLMNIDSELKVTDIGDYFSNISFMSPVWIDGSRTLPDGDWWYEYGSHDTTFSIWNSSDGEPDSEDDCKIFSSSRKLKWWGKKCTETFYYLCEII